MITEPGLYDVPEAEYHADPVPETSLSVSGAKKLLDCPARFKWESEHPPVKSAFDFGHAAHAKILGAGMACEVIPADLLASNGAASTKEAKAFIEDCRARGVVPLKAEDVAVIDAMADQIAAHPIASRLLASGVAEQSMFWRDESTAVMLRGRADHINSDAFGRPCVVDYKTTTRTANPARFGWEARDYDYHMQDAWYREGLDLITGEEHGFVFIVQEKSAPYLVSVVELDNDSREEAASRNALARQIYLDCMTRDEWPGYAPLIHPVSIFRRLQGAAA